MEKLPPEEYYTSLPKKRMAAGVLFFNDKEELLLVKTNYKEAWSIPGGVVDEDESPRAAAMREVREEIGLEVAGLSLLCVDYTVPQGIKTESLQFVFSGGVLTEEQISRIRLQDGELETYRFMSADQAILMLNPGVKERLPDCLKALREGSACYLES